jgi:GNAT superfamily N-acetyltransferase
MEDIQLADLGNPAHAEAVVHLLNEYAKDEMGGGAELSAYVKQNLARELAKRPGFHTLLAFNDGKPVGLAICIEGFSTFACRPLLNIHDMVVVREYRGRGIAKRLLARAEEIALTLGCCKLTLEVLEGNAPAQAVYRACGFEGYQLDPKMGRAMFWQKKLA